MELQFVVIPACPLSYQELICSEIFLVPGALQDIAIPVNTVPGCAIAYSLAEEIDK